VNPPPPPDPIAALADRVNANARRLDDHATRLRKIEGNGLVRKDLFEVVVQGLADDIREIHKAAEAAAGEAHALRKEIGERYDSERAARESSRKQIRNIAVAAMFSAMVAVISALVTRALS
jgi:hypothetical protein